jgi:hypothetical protein
MEETKKSMDFGKKYRVGNFTVLKYTKSLTKKGIEEGGAS